MTRVKRAAPYLLAGAGVVAITALIALVTRRIAVPNLSVLYVLLVLWIGARHGRNPALLASFLSFLAYDFFFVAPVGTFTVAGPAQLLELVLLLAAALVTGQLAASLERARAHAASAAAESGGLYELATAVLRVPEVEAALGLVAERAAATPGVAASAIVGFDGSAPQVLAGELARADDAGEAAWAYEARRAVGCELEDGVLALHRISPPRPDRLAVLPLTSGAFVLRADAAALDAPAARLLGALAAMAELLLERRRAALEADRRRAAEASDSLKAAVLSSLSHELKSPLASLRAGLTSLLPAGAGLTPAQHELVAGLDGQALRLDRLVDDLLVMSRLEAGAAPRLEPVAVQEVVGGVIGRLEGRLAGRVLKLDLPAELPPVLADELQLGRVLTNLLENAVDWTAPGAVIELGARAGSHDASVWVANEGPGIAPIELDHVFDKFWTRRREGSGLGLAICRRIVEAQGGTIGVKNLRAGPEFRFTLPLAPEPAAVP